MNTCDTCGQELKHTDDSEFIIIVRYKIKAKTKMEARVMLNKQLEIQTQRFDFYFVKSVKILNIIQSWWYK